VKKLFVVIPKFNGEKEIKDCLASLQLIKVPKGWEIKIIVVDNSKSDKKFPKSLNLYTPKSLNLYTPKSLNLYTPKPLYPYTPIFSQRNLGFAGGVNVGIKEALKNGAEAVLLLNQDTKVKKDFLFPLLENQADIVGPVIKFKRKGKWIYDFGGRINWWLGRNKHWEIQNPKAKIQNKFKIQNSKTDKNHLGRWQAERSEAMTPPGWREIDYISGCAMMIRRGVFEKIGLFDERYFLYFEDADFCLRAKKAGFKIAVEPKSVIVHQLKEGKKKPFWQRWQLVKSNLIFINRWICWWRRPLAWGFWLGRGIKILIG